MNSHRAAGFPVPSAVVMLAAGAGTRMRSRTPKVLHAVCGRTLVHHALAAVEPLAAQSHVVVIGHGREQVGAEISRVAPTALQVVQEEQRGTGHALRVALAGLDAQVPEAATHAGPVLLAYGDVPLIQPETFTQMLSQHAHEQAAATILTAQVPNPTGYGRIVREASGAVQAIVEEKDATEQQRAITEINSGVISFDPVLVRELLPHLSTTNAQGEEYVTDIISMLVQRGHRVSAYQVAQAAEIEGVNTLVQLAQAGQEMRDRLVAHWQLAGVQVVDPASTWIDADVELSAEVVLHPGTLLHGHTRVAAGAQLGPYSVITDSVIGEGACVQQSTVTDSEIGAHAQVGPFAHLRPGSVLGVESKVGAFAETKAAQLGDRAKIPHLCYVGDATVGEGANLGAGTITVNYDGEKKHQTKIGAQARVGSSTMLVAPVEVGQGAYTAAGSVITEDVPAGALAVARGRQHNSEEWVHRRRPDSASAAAARALNPPSEQTNTPQQDSATNTTHSQQEEGTAS